MSADDIVVLLDELIHTSQDGRMGYAEAAEFARDAELKRLFLLRSAECAKAVDDLQLAVQTLGREPVERGTVAGAVHRGWVRVQAGLRDNNLAVLEELERGEAHAEAVYARVQATRLPPEVVGLVQEQYRAVLRNLNEVRNLGTRYRSAS